MGSRAVRGILSCALALLVVACSDDGGGSEASESSTSSSTTTVPPGPSLETNTDDVVAATRSLVEFDSWTQRNPEQGLERSDEWLVAGGPYAVRVEEGLREQLERELAAEGEAEILEVRAESQRQSSATVLVWLRADEYAFAGPNETLPSPAFERTLFVYELQRGADGRWKVREVRVPQQ